MKVIELAACAAFVTALAAGAVAEGATWYFSGGNDTADANRGVLNPAKWKDAAGNIASAFSTEDEYVVRNGRLRIQGQAFAGGPIHFGDLSQTGAMRRGGICQDNTTAGAAFPNGASFDCGYYWVNIYVSPLPEAMRDVTLDASWINVRAPVDAPFVFYCQPAPMYNNRRVLVTAPLISDETAGIVIGPAMSAGGDYTACGTNFTVALVGDCSAYKGTISVTTAQEVVFGKHDVALLLGDITVDGKVRLAAGTAIEARKGVRNQYAGGAPAECTVGSLELAANSMIQVPGNTTTPKNGIIHVRDSLSVERPVALKLNDNARTPSTNEATRLTVLTAPSSSRLDADDFVLDIGPTSAAQRYDFFVEEDVATQMKSLVVEFKPTVWQKGQYGNEGGKDRTPGDSSLTNVAHWSDGLLPHGGAHYYSERHYLRTLVDETLDYDFPGLSFTQVGGRLTILTKSFHVPEYCTRGSSTIWLGQAYKVVKTIDVDRFVAKSGTVDLGAYNDQTLVIDGEIVGAADFLLRGVNSTSATRGNYRLAGMNTNFTGNITVSHLHKDQWNFNDKFQTLYAADGRNFGGAKAAFDPAALTLADMCRLYAEDDITLAADLNRGLYIESAGRLYVAASKTLAVYWPLTMHGRLWKEGEGTLILGGEARFDSADGAPEATSNLFTVANGTVKVTAYNAMDGLETTFHSGTSLVLALNPEDANLTKYGILNAKTETPFILGNGLDKLPLTVDTSAYPMVARVPLSFGIVTVTNAPATLTAVRAMLPTVKPYSDVRQSIVERANASEGTVTFALELKHVGTRFVVR